MILSSVRSTIKENNLIKKRDKILVAVSGGPDSVTLLYILNSLKKELRLNLYVAHLNHMLRAQSDSDERFVEGLASKFNLPFISSRIDVKKISKNGSLEEIAREARLDFLVANAKEIKADSIAIGHTRDDQAETVIMRILRGSGLYGLSAIMPKRNIKNMNIIRPLLEISRQDVERFLKNKKIIARIDSSNLEEVFFRNKIRNRLLPLLGKEYSVNIKEILSNLADSAGCDYDYLLIAAKQKLSHIGSMRYANKVNLNLAKLLKQHISMQRMVVRLSISKIKGDLRSVSFRHMKEIEDLIHNRPIGSIVDLPKGVSVAKNTKTLSFYRR